MKRFCYIIFFLYSLCFAADSTIIIPSKDTVSKVIDTSIIGPNLLTVGDTYAGLPVCPLVPVCPDANNFSSSTACPQKCRSDQVIHDVSLPGYPNWIRSVDFAQCPNGYVATHVFGQDDEVKWDANPITILPPISRDQYTILVQQGFNCDNQPGVEETRVGFCRRDPWFATCAAGDPPSSSDNQRYCVFGQGPDPVQQPIDTVCNSDDGPSFCGGMVRIVSKRKFRVCYGTCWSYEDSWCAYGGQSTFYGYKKIQCSSPGGRFYRTGNKVPKSLVCSRVQPYWK